MTPASRPEACQVWTLDPERLNAAGRRACRGLLSTAERKRADRFRFARDREAYEAAHALVRIALSRRAPATPPAAWEFETDAQGRPEVSGGGARCGLRFNLSHTRGLVGCVVARGLDCGIDVEAVDRRLRLDDLAGVVLSAAERESLDRAAPADRQERFLRYWTLKEAYAKARGLGLSLALKRVRFELEGDAPRLAEDPTWTEPLETWRFHQWVPAPRRLLAVALRVGGAPGDAEPQIERIRPAADEIIAWNDG